MIDIDDDLDDLDDDCDDDDVTYCSHCDGTGIGPGDPDTSRCRRCHGLGAIKPAPDYDDYDPPEPNTDSAGDWGLPGDGRYL